MTTYVPVDLGIEMRRALGSKRLTKKWLREYLAAHPAHDFVNLGPGGTYVNGNEALRYGLVLEVHDVDRSIATVTFTEVGDADALEATVR